MKKVSLDKVINECPVRNWVSIDYWQKKKQSNKNIKQTEEDVKKDNVSESDTQNYEAERTMEFSNLKGENRELETREDRVSNFLDPQATI